MKLNEQAHAVADAMVVRANSLRIGVQHIHRARVMDCGITAPGGLEAGLTLARVCLADRALVSLVPSPLTDLPGGAVQVASDDPVLACMASQYAGWQVAVGNYFAMGSGPMRAAYGKEELFDHLHSREWSPVVVGVLESRKLPTEAVIDYLAERVRIEPDHLTLLCAPTGSLAGTVQVVARSLETALHKLHELKFDLQQVVSGLGVAPLPPVGTDDLAALGRTNDAILYGGQVTVWVRGDDDQLAEIGPKVPSSASPDHGAPFVEIFNRYDRDFYKIDPMLFSPAVIVLVNLLSGRRHVFGRLEPDVLQRSFGG
ncbi:MAG: methenyltetrahydromethanopterin cyclohydrolase [Gemmataceae bacterium]